jgi:hypothetical protein
MNNIGDSVDILQTESTAIAKRHILPALRKFVCLEEVCSGSRNESINMSVNCR